MPAAHPVPDALREIPTVANGDVSKDGLTLKYKLRPNIKWQDGPALTCEDLKFTWQVVMNPHNNVVTTDGYKDIGSIDCSNPYVAVIHMKKLYAPFLQQLWSENGNAPILPKHLLAKYNDDKGSFNTAAYNSLPVGSGPFKIVAWNRGQDVRMVANPNFYLGPPKLKEVIYKILPDENTAVTQLQTHELDMLGARQRFEMAGVRRACGKSAQRRAGNSRRRFRVVARRLQPPPSDRRATSRSAALSRMQPTGTKLSIKCFMDRRFRPIPISSRTIRGRTPTTSPIIHTIPRKPTALLDADGWKVGPGGIRVKDGQRLEFTLEHPNRVE